jgi:hypothetical protein
MNLASLAQALRDTSDRFGGIGHFLEAAGALDRAASSFLRNQDLESLRELNGAVALAERYRKGTVVGKRPEVV